MKSFFNALSQSHLKALPAMILIIATFALPARSQILTQENPKAMADSVQKAYSLGSYFRLYKDNYFTVGTALGQKPTKLNSDVKFQISLAIRLTNATLPWNTYLYLFYTQKTFWNVFQNSMPMRDLNFNPGIGLAKPFFVKNRFIGQLAFIVEHESNGRDGEDSRSWNRISLAGNAIITDNLNVHAKYWIPIVDGMNNKDLLKYAGIFQMGFNVITNNKRWQFGATFVKRRGWNFNWNTIAEISWRVEKQSNMNLFLQYYNGFGENLIDYNQFHSRLRFGLVFKPTFFSEY